MFDPWVGKIPWRREWLPTPVFLPGEFHEQRNLVGYSPWGRKESDMTEELTLSLSFHISMLKNKIACKKKNKKNRNVEAFCKQNEDGIRPSEKEEKRLPCKRLPLEQAF